MFTKEVSGLVPSAVYLSVQTEYSLLKSAIRLPELIQWAKLHQISSLAIADDSVLYGVVPFYRQCREAGIHPVIGMQVWLPPVVQAAQAMREAYSLVLLAKNRRGFQNLVRLSTLIMSRKKPLLPSVHRPLVSLEELVEHREGVLVLSGGATGEVGRLVARGQWQAATEAAGQYLASFGTDSFFLQIEALHSQREKEAYRQLAKACGLNLVVSPVIRGLSASDRRTLHLLECIREGKKIEELPAPEDGIAPSPDELRQMYADMPWAVENARVLAEQCQVELDEGKRRMPHYPLPEGVTAEAYLTALCHKGAEKRYGTPLPAEVQERLSHELKVIQNMGFADYFLIVWDFVRYAHEQGILVGPGRGSAAGSLVAYVLGITQVDPLRWGLLFERFMNPARINMPDIDIDFSYDRRDEVIRYVAGKYGRQRVAQIVTFGTLAARAAVRDAGRALGMSPRQVDAVCRLIPAQKSIREAVDSSPQLQRWMQTSPETKRLIEDAQRIEGLKRHTSTHAAGVVLSHQPLLEEVPLQEGHEHLPLTQYTMDILEQLGYLKVDFLGLKNLTIIESSLSFARSANKESLPNIQQLPLDDKAVYQLLQEGRTTGIFQLESEGMRRLLREMKPERFEDIVAAIALFRPGPMEFIPHYLQARMNPRAVQYPDPSLEPILKDTYGIIVYQEQIMQIASRMAGFTLGEADLLRRAVAKKDKAAMDEQRSRFLAGCQEAGYPLETARRVWEMIERFAAYGFNRSHAVAYAMLAYQTAYLKAHHPLAFMASIMSESLGNPEKIKSYLPELQALGIPLLPPCVQRSGLHFQPEGHALRYPLTGIRHVGVQAVDSILKARKDGPFEDLYDFCARVNLQYLNRRVLESLIFSGAMDALGGHRAQLLAALDECMAWGQKVQQEMSQPGFFAERARAGRPYPEMEPFTPEERSRYEQQVLGFSLSAPPAPVYIRISPRANQTHRLNQLRSLLRQYAGDHPVILVYEGSGRALMLKPEYNVTPTAAFSQAVEQLLGPGTYAFDPQRFS